MNTISPVVTLPNGSPVSLDSSSASMAAASGNASTPNNQLGANSFITLLTAQLQAQDPLNPLDPNQMVDELTSMNTLQQIIQIRQDMDSLLSTAAVTGSAGGSNPPSTPAQAASSLNSTLAKPQIAGPHTNSVFQF